MARREYLSSEERLRFETPPQLSTTQRSLLLMLPEWAKRYLHLILTPTNQVGFLLQLGYFRIVSRFFPADTFPQVDIEYIRQGLSIEDSQLDLLIYKNSRSCYRHREEILTNLGVAPFSSRQQELLSVEAKRMARNQTKPTLILDALVNYLLEHQMEVPSYHTLKTILQEALDSFEAELLAILDRSLRPEDAQLLDDLLSKQQVYQERIGASSSVQRYELTFFKRIPQSMRPGEIKKRVEMFQELKRMHEQLWPVINRLDLSPPLSAIMPSMLLTPRPPNLK